MASRKNWTVKVRERGRQVMSVLIVVFLVAFLMTFDKVAELVANVLGTTKETIQEVSSMIMWTVVGLMFIKAAAWTSGLPFVPIGFAIIGGIILVVQAVRLYNMTRSDNDDEGGQGQLGGTTLFEQYR